MSLDRFSNKDSILSTIGPQRGVIWNEDIIPSLLLDTKDVQIPKNSVVEVHVYSEQGSYIGGDIVNDYNITNNKLLINYSDILTTFELSRGFFDITTVLYSNIIGSLDNSILQIKEISPDRREIFLSLAPMAADKTEVYKKILERYFYEYDNPYDHDLALNLGANRIYKIINQRRWQDGLAVRLYKPLTDDIIVNDVLCIINELVEPFIDNIQLNSKLLTPDGTNLRGPNFNVTTEYNTLTETEFKSWSDLLNTNLSTSQQVINNFFSGSINNSRLGIDYTAFNNFVYYGSAAERLINFKSKLDQLEYYNTQLSVLDDATGTDETFANNITLYNTRIQDTLGTFDDFEKWLYYNNTSSLSTHGTSGSYIGSDAYAVTPWPKYLSGSKYYVHTTTSTLGTNWFNGFYATASAYDEQNSYSLVKTIPEHIRLDQNNSSYELFVNMIGHHFDILYTHINALTKIYYPEEQPKLGVDKDILFHIAESMGWQLANGRQASSLWQYKLGVDSNGIYQSTGSLFSKSDEEITTEIWRRVVNNLPYLLKTKGTSRSIKALMNIYGIPQTLLSIREYGGPHPDAETPALIEDRFAYTLQLTGSNNNRVIIPAIQYPTGSIDDWGLGLSSTSGEVAPITRELRFRPTIKHNMMLLSYNSTSTTTAAANSIIAIEYTGSYSGSSEYGRLWHTYSSGSSGNRAISSSTEWMPLFDGDIWNLRWWWEGGSTDYNTTNTTNSDTTYYIQVQKASDYISGKIIHIASSSVTPIGNLPGTIWAAPADGRTSGYINIGGIAATNGAVFANLRTNIGGTLNRFTGDIQEYREWCERLNQDTFNIHTLNPTSYVSSLNATASYNTLVRHYTFGSDVLAYNHNSEQLIITSSHPANHIKDFTSIIPYNGSTTGYVPGSSNTYASASGFLAPTDTERGNYIPIEETYYIDGVSLGGQLPRSEKIRLEDNYLIRRLSPTNTAERSTFDYAPIDSNRLGLFYSQADQVNKDIFDHIGDIAMDDYIGNPEDEFDFQYPQLRNFSTEYWKKYVNRNDINAFIRIFSQFDFTLFNQIKQLLPERIDEATGLLVEPHALERNKIALTKRVVIENPQYEFTLPGLQPTASSEVATEYSASISTSYIVSADSVYHSGSNGYADTGNTLANIVLRDHTVPTEYLVEEVPLDQIGNATTLNIITNFSKTNTGLARENNVTGTVWKLQFPYNNNFENTTSSSLGSIGAITSQLITEYYLFNQLDIKYNTISVTPVIHDYLGNNNTLNARCSLCTINDDNIITVLSSINSVITLISGDESTQTVYTFNDIRIPAYTNRFGVILEYINNGPEIQVNLLISNLSVNTQLEKVYTSAIRPEILQNRTSKEFKTVVYHYSGSINTSDKILKNAYHATSQSLGLYYSSSLIPSEFNDDDILQINNAKYYGCKLTAPDININSNIAAINNTPVIEVYETNANQLIFTENSLAINNNQREPGNLRIR